MKLTCHSFQELPARPNNASVYSEVDAKKAELASSGVPTSSHAPEPYAPSNTTKKSTVPDPSINSGSAVSSKNFPGDEPGYHPAELHPPSASAKDGHNELKENTTNSSHGRPESINSTTTAGGSPKKVGFKEKVSGGSKVLMGKLGRNEEKIDEGRRILHGETA